MSIAGRFDLKQNACIMLTEKRPHSREILGSRSHLPPHHSGFASTQILILPLQGLDAWEVAKSTKNQLLMTFEFGKTIQQKSPIRAKRNNSLTISLSLPNQAKT